MAPLGSLSFALILAILCQVIASSTIPRPQWAGMKGGSHSPQIGTPAPSEGRMTNAKRFAAGLPPLPPARSKRRAIHAPRQSTSPTITGTVRFVLTDSGVPIPPVALFPSTILGVAAVDDASVPFYIITNPPSGTILLGLTSSGIDPTNFHGFATLSQAALPPSTTPAQLGPGEAYESTFWYYIPALSQLYIKWDYGLGPEFAIRLKIWQGHFSSGLPVPELVLAYDAPSDPIVSASYHGATWQQVNAKFTPDTQQDAGQNEDGR
ncbi:hypothetical protein FRB99_000347 [Tulasnella sp. 403]|nr:hypothetical protein FRB99_000347 [Tulasnella sp. 403]